MFRKRKKISIKDPVISARETVVLWQYLLKHGSEIEKFFDGINIPRKRLFNKREWIDIHTSARITQNYRSCIPDYDMTMACKVAFEQFDSYAYGFTSAVFRLPPIQYVFKALPYIMTIPTKIEFFRILESDLQSAVMEYTISPGFEPFIDSCFIYTWLGVFSAIPTIHGLSPAKVEAVASFVDVFKRFREDFGQFKHHIEEKDETIYLDGEKAGRWITINKEVGLDPIIHKYLTNERCILWEKDVVETKNSGNKITLAKRGDLYNCSKTLLRLNWENINFISRTKNFFLFLKQYLPTRIQSRETLHRQADILYEYSSLLKQKVKEKTDEVHKVQAKMFELEKHSIEHRITGGFAHEMRNALAGAQLEIKAAMHYRNNREPATDSLKKSVAVLVENISQMHQDSSSAKDKIILDSLRELKQINETADHLSEIISGVSNDIERGLSITTLIRDYSKLYEIKAGDTPVDIFRVLKRFSREYKINFREHGIQYRVNCGGSVFYNADETHLNSIFSNVILNARDALVDDATDQPEIIVTVENKAGRILIGIQDNGPGIKQEMRKEIFKPFYSTKPMTGTGLGLSIVKRLLALYN